MMLIGIFALSLLIHTPSRMPARPVPGPIIEIRNPKANEYHIVCLIKLPALDAYDRTLVSRLMGLMARGTSDFNDSEVQAITGGRLVDFRLMPDHLAIEFPAVKPYLESGLGVLAGLLRDLPTDEPQAQQTSSDAVTSSAPGPPAGLAPVGAGDPWIEAIHGELVPPPAAKVRKRELTDLYHRLIRPSAITTAIEGPFAENEANQIWQRKISGWLEPDLPPPAVIDSGQEPWPCAVQSIELSGVEIDPTSSSLAGELLAEYALGCGKGGSLHRIVRDRDGVSYRQEAVLSPTLTGWRPRLVVVADGLEDAEAYGKTMRDELREDVNRWDESVRVRALGMATGTLRYGIPVSPFYFRPDRPVYSDDYDLPIMSAYWKMKTGQAWNSERLLDEMSHVTLADLQSAAQEFLTSSQLIVRRPSQP